jgi:hypothetical protein
VRLFRLGAVGLELSSGGRGHVSGARYFFSFPRAVKHMILTHFFSGNKVCI